MVADVSAYGTTVKYDRSGASQRDAEDLRRVWFPIGSSVSPALSTALVHAPAD